MTRSSISHVLVNDKTIPLVGTPLTPGTTSPVSYLINQAIKSQNDDLATNAFGVAHMHTRTAEILHRICVPPSPGSLLPFFLELPMVRCAAYSSTSDMQLYAVDIQSIDGHLHPYLWQLSGAFWDTLHVADNPSLLELRTCLMV